MAVPMEALSPRKAFRMPVQQPGTLAPLGMMSGFVWQANKCVSWAQPRSPRGAAAVARGAVACSFQRRTAPDVIQSAGMIQGPVASQWHAASSAVLHVM